MAGKTKKREVSPYDRFSTDDRATDLKSMGITLGPKTPLTEKEKAIVKAASSKKRAPAKKKPTAKK